MPEVLSSQLPSGARDLLRVEIPAMTAMRFPTVAFMFSDVAVIAAMAASAPGTSTSICAGGDVWSWEAMVAKVRGEWSII